MKQRWPSISASSGGEPELKRAGELRVPIVDQEPRLLAAVVEIDVEVPSLLKHPRSIGVAGARDVLDPAATNTDEHEHVQPTQQDGVDGEEVAGEHRRRVLAHERAPGETITLRRRRDTGLLQDVPDERRRHLDAELAQFANDPEIAPAGVLTREPHDQLAHPLIDRRSPGERCAYVQCLATRRRCQRSSVSGRTRNTCQDRSRQEPAERAQKQLGRAT